MATKPSLDAMESHDLQMVMALFLSHPQLYADHIHQKNKELYFFREFHKFARNYYRLDPDQEPDAAVYFHCVEEAPVSSVSVCGGMGRRRVSLAAKSHFKREVAVQRSAWIKRVREFEARHRIQFDRFDPRRFLGERQIWTKLHRSDDIVALSKWPAVAQIAYSDVSFRQPLPLDLEKRLVPFAIRDRVCEEYTKRLLRSEARSPTTTVFVDCAAAADAREEPDFCGEQAQHVVVGNEEKDWSPPSRSKST